MPAAPACSACFACSHAIATLPPTPAMTGMRPPAAPDRRPDDVSVFLYRQRVELAGAAGCDEHTERMLRHDLDVVSQALEVERAIGGERRHRKADDSPRDWP